MSESTDFANNPFALLAQRFVSAETSHAKVPLVMARLKNDAEDKGVKYKDAGHTAPRQGSMRSAPRQAHVVEGEEVDDNTLFMQAVQNVRPTAMRSKSTLPEAQWQLADSVELSNMSKHVAKLEHAKVKAQTKAHPKTLVNTQPDPAQSKVGDATVRKTEMQVNNALREMVDIVFTGEATPADEQAFLRAMREVQPLAGKGREVAPEVEPAVSAEQAANILQEFMDGKLEFALSLTGEHLEGYVVGLDDITMNKLRAGQYRPEAHLDLHGLNAVQAYQALVGFFRNAWYKGMRALLVVPGRGRNSMDGIGVLRDKLQDWLTQDPFKRVVLAFSTARPMDGGPGSVYVLLRKCRKKSRVVWECTPTDPDLF